MKTKYSLYILLCSGIISCAPSGPTVVIDCSCNDADCQIKKNGEPTFKYKDEFKSLCFGYKGPGGDVAHNCFESGCGWSSRFTMPDTTEEIGNNNKYTIRSMFLDNYYKVFNSKEIENNQVQIYVLPSFKKEVLITINLNDKTGRMIQPCDSSGWAEMNVRTEHGGYVKSSDEYEPKQVLCELNNELGQIIDLIVKYPVYQFGDISKKGVMMMDGTTIIIRAKTNNKEYFSEFAMVPWYDNRYDAISHEIEALIKE